MNPQSGLVNKNDQNKVSGKFIHNYSSFPDSLSRSRAYTARFGEYTPSFVFDGVERDQISVNSVDKIDSYSLNSPFKGTIRKIKESFCVPKMALLPLNWDKIYIQPTTGDDVPDNANCVLLDFPAKFSLFWLHLFSICSSAAKPTTLDEFNFWLTAIMRMLVTGEFIYSDGSLLAYCGYHGNAQIQFSQPDQSYDNFFDSFIRALFTNITFFYVNYGERADDVDNIRLYRGLSGANPSSLDYAHINSFRNFLTDFRENPSAFISVPDDTLDFGSIYDVVQANIFRQFNPTFNLPDSNPDSDIKDLQPSSLNLSRVIAYQMVCAHFYSNSGIDFIYTAELFRQYFRGIFEIAYPTASFRDLSFMYNGVLTEYDVFSGASLSLMLYNRLSNGVVDNRPSYDVLKAPVFGGVNFDYLHFLLAMPALFGFRRSLRYGDYFVGSRTRPLAPFNSNVAVDNNSVSVIDITKRIQGQRFANAVMRTRSKIENYVKGMFGQAPAPDYHNPFYLAREVETVFGDEVQNTAENLNTNRPNSRSALMTSNGGRYTFTFNNDDNHPCIYIQLISFDVRRHYTQSVDRQMLQVNRYDMFNPDFQYIGDQPVHGIELGYAGGQGSGRIIYNVFGYQGRDMEYKQSFDIALGGAIRHLPGWFVTDRGVGRVNVPIIDSEFIRSYPAELDQFYLSLTGFSNGTYFHFIINTINHIAARRAMAVDPQILA